jgi:N-acetylmuramoyl-L-alanine amidase
MAGYYTVQQGDCLSSIAKAYGFSSYDTIWKRAENSEVKKKRKQPNILQPGDRIFIPDKEMRIEDGSVDQKHNFVIYANPTMLEIVVQVDEEPVANAQYTLDIDNVKIVGTTNGSGLLRQPIEQDAARGHLHFDKPPLDWDLEIGGLDPVDEPSGIQPRLSNLGFFCGSADGLIGPRTRGALRGFQKRYGLTPNGKADDPTKQELKKLHGDE